MISEKVPLTGAEEPRRFVAAGATTLILRLAAEDQREQIELCTRYLFSALG